MMKVEDIDMSKRYSYADYLTWQFDEMVELINGAVHKMSPAPNRWHQRVSSFLHGELYQFLKGKTCEVYHAPFDVRFPKKGDDTNEQIYHVVQPDICVICDPKKLDDKGCLGAPDLVVEILSPSTSKKDLNEKYDLYESQAVKEYWIVYPESKSITIHSLNEKGKYESSRPYNTAIISSTALTGFQLDLRDVFED